MNRILLFAFFLSIATTKLTIWGPQWLRDEYKDKPEIKYSIATFGKVPYGHSLLGSVEMGFPFDACQKITLPVLKISKDSPFFIISERGGCKFSEKAQNAQNAGASAILIVDNVEEDPEKIFVISKDNVAKNKIVIPTLLLERSHAEELLTFAKKSIKLMEGGNEQELLASISFDVTKFEKSNIQYFFEITDRKSIRIFSDLFNKYANIRKSITISPVFFMENLPQGTTIKDPYSCVYKSKICQKAQGMVLINKQ